MSGNKITSLILLCLCLSVLPGQFAYAQQKLDATLLTFRETDSGTTAINRIWVTEQFLRMEYENDDGDFLLYDRRHQTINNISSLDGTVLVIQAQPIELDQPKPFDSAEKTLSGGTTGQLFSNQTVKRIALETNGTLCFELAVIKGFLPQAGAALSEYRHVLAGEQAISSASIPPRFRDICDLTHNIFKPGLHLGSGFPIFQKDWLGRSRELIEFNQNVATDAAIFMIPTEYRRFTLEQMRGGS